MVLQPLLKVLLIPQILILTTRTSGQKRPKTKRKNEKNQEKRKKKPLTPVDSTFLLRVDSLKQITRPKDSFLTDSLAQKKSPLAITSDTSFVQDSTYYEPAEKEKNQKKSTSIDDFRAPLTPQSQGNNFTGGFTYTTIGDESFVGMTLSPEFSVSNVGIGLNIPILYGLDSKSIRTEVFTGGVGPARLIRYVRYGVKKRDPIYVKAGQLDGIMIGFGGLVNNYSNTTSFEKRKVGLHFDLNYKGYVGIEGMYSDFDPASINLLVVRPYVRPLSFTDIPIVHTLELGGTFLMDSDQTSTPTSDSTSTTHSFTGKGLNAFGLDMGITVFKIPFIQIDLFANYSDLSIKNDSLQSRATVLLGNDSFVTGSGKSFGANFRLHFIADVLSTDIRIERLIYEDHYLPQLFDAVYELDKDEKIHSLISSEKKGGIYGSLTGHVLQKVKLGGSLMIPDDFSETSPAVVRVHADVERLANKFSLHGSYIKGNLNNLSDAFTLDDQSLAKVRFIYHIHKFLAAGADYYYGFSQVEDGSYQVTKTIIPYFGVSISF